MRALSALVEHEALGQRARFERYAASMLYAIAAGIKIDTDRVERFGAQVDKVYANPFVTKKQEPRTAAEIKAHLIERIDELLSGGVETHGSDDAGREDHAG